MKLTNSRGTSSLAGSCIQNLAFFAIFAFEVDDIDSNQRKSWLLQWKLTLSGMPQIACAIFTISFLILFCRFFEASHSKCSRIVPEKGSRADGSSWSCHSHRQPQTAHFGGKLRPRRQLQRFHWISWRFTGNPMFHREQTPWIMVSGSDVIEWWLGGSGEGSGFKPWDPAWALAAFWACWLWLVRELCYAIYHSMGRSSYKLFLGVLYYFMLF